MSSYYEDLVTAFDGSTGQITGAIRADAYEGIARIMPAHVNGRLWVASQEHEPVDRAPVAVFDERTLRPVLQFSAITPVDMTAEQTNKLHGSP